MSMKNPLTPAGIEPATFRIVAQHSFEYITAKFVGETVPVPHVCSSARSFRGYFFKQ